MLPLDLFYYCMNIHHNIYLFYICPVHAHTDLSLQCFVLNPQSGCGFHRMSDVRYVHTLHGSQHHLLLYSVPWRVRFVCDRPDTGHSIQKTTALSLLYLYLVRPKSVYQLMQWNTWAIFTIWTRKLWFMYLKKLFSYVENDDQILCHHQSLPPSIVCICRVRLDLMKLKQKFK